MVKIENEIESSSISFSKSSIACIESGSHSSPFHHNKQLLSKYFEALQPGGKLIIYAKSITKPEEESALKLTGFVIEENSLEYQKLSVKIVSSKPEYEMGTSVLLKRGVSIPVDDDLIDEDSLLEDSDFVKPNARSLQKPDACETKKKACKNCTCGRADMEAESVKISDVASDINNLPKSSCGSCYLGDAFRCDGCPYKGMPAFKPGERVSLDLGADV